MPTVAASITTEAELPGVVVRVRAQFLRLVARPAGALAVLLLALGIITAAGAPYLAPEDPMKTSDATYLAPSREHLMGTDNLGRDVLSRVIWGSRISIMIAVVSAGISAALGVLLGAVSGFYGGLVDDLLARFFDIFLMIPRFMLVILLAALLGGSVWLTMLIIGLTVWPSNARIMRSQVLSLKERGYARASIAVGASSWRTLFLHIVPNGIYPVLANTTLQMGTAILIEAGLSFLGLGDANRLSWGRLVYQGRDYMGTAWWIAFFSGLAITLLTLAFNLLGDELNYLFNPRLM